MGAGGPRFRRYSEDFKMEKEYDIGLGDIKGTLVEMTMFRGLTQYFAQTGNYKEITSATKPNDFSKLKRWDNFYKFLLEGKKLYRVNTFAEVLEREKNAYPLDWKELPDQDKKQVETAVKNLDKAFR